VSQATVPQEEDRFSFVWEASDVQGKRVKLYRVTQRFLNDFQAQKARIYRLETRIDFLFNETERVSARLLSLEKPLVKAEILEYLRANPDCSDRFLAEKYRTSPEERWLAFNYAWQDLVNSGAMVGTAHGRGRRKTWRVSA